MRSGVNPGTHILGPDPVSAYFGLYLYFNAVQSSRDLVFMGLKFIEDYIFLSKKIFFESPNLTSFAKWLFSSVTDQMVGLKFFLRERKTSKEHFSRIIMTFINSQEGARGPDMSWFRTMDMRSRVFSIPCVQELRALSSRLDQPAARFCEFLLQRYTFSIFEGASAQFELFTENIKYF